MLALAGCAVRPHRPGRDHAATTGTILAMRQPIPGARTPARRRVLAALGVSAGAPTVPVTEFTVRETDGAVVSILQPDSVHLHPGQRVRILNRPVLRLVPLDAGS